MKHPDKILSMSKFVLWIRDNGEDIELNRITLLDLIVWYAELLQTPLSLEMFVAVKDGEILKEPKQTPKDSDWCSVQYKGKMYPVALGEEWIQARKKILFEGPTWNERGYLDYDNWGIEFEEGEVLLWNVITSENGKAKTIEDIIRQLNLTGTENFWNLIFKP